MVRVRPVLQQRAAALTCWRSAARDGRVSNSADACARVDESGAAAAAAAAASTMRWLSAARHTCLPLLCASK